MTPVGAWHFTRRWLWLFAVVAVVAAAASYVVSTQLPRVYEGTAKLLVTPAQSGIGANYNDILTAERLTRTYSQVLVTRPIVEAAIAQAGLDLDYQHAIALLDVTPIKDTQLIQVTARASTPDQAASFANQLTVVFVRQTQASQSSRFAASEESLARQVDGLARDIADHSQRIDAARADPQAGASDTTLLRLQSELSQLQQSYSAAVRSLEDLRVAEARSIDLLQVVEPAAPNPIPVAPRTLVNVILATLMGLLVAGAVALAIDRLDDRLTTPERLTRLTGLHPLGTIQLAADGPPKPLDLVAPTAANADLGYASNGTADSFQLLRANLQFAAVEEPFRRLLITSASAEEGKTTAASNLAVVMAQAGQRVLLVDADLRRPSVHSTFGLSNRHGLTTLLMKQTTPSIPPLVEGMDLRKLEGSIQNTPVPGLWVVPSGPLPPNPGELLASRRMRALLDTLSDAVDLVVIDSPPVLPVSDPAVLAGLVDGVVVIVNARGTRGHQATHAVETLRKAGGHVLGAVLNRVATRRAGYSYSYTSYSSNSQVAGTTPP